TQRQTSPPAEGTGQPLPSALASNFSPGRRGFAQWQMQAEEDPVPLNGSGVAAWNDFSAVPTAARDTLREAAGILIPKSSFVVWTLAVYLFVLVPLNWAIFWLCGRVEWAWIAAGLIALCGVAAVVKLAQLDIGFARSQTELALLELHGGYPRGHL